MQTVKKNENYDRNSNKRHYNLKQYISNKNNCYP